MALPGCLRSCGAALLVTLCVLMSACAASPTATRRMPPPSPKPIVGHLTRFPLPPGVPRPYRITDGPDGTLWFTAFDIYPQRVVLWRPIHDAVVRLTLPGAFRVFSLPYPGSLPDGIVAGPAGTLWFTEFYGGAVGRITPQGTLTEFLVPPRRSHDVLGNLTNSQPHAVAVGADGNLWFPDLGGSKLGRLTPAGVLMEFALPKHAENPIGSFPYGIVAGPDGAIWFTEQAMRIGRITPSGRITEFALPGVNHVPADIVAGADGALWFLEPNQSLLGRITTAGHITEFLLPHPACYTPGVTSTTTGSTAVGLACQVEQLATGPDGAIWFSEPWRSALGRVDEQGHIAEFPVPGIGPDGPEALAAGPDGALWFTYDAGIGRFSL